MTEMTNKLIRDIKPGTQFTFVHGDPYVQHLKACGTHHKLYRDEVLVVGEEPYVVLGDVYSELLWIDEYTEVRQ